MVFTTGDTHGDFRRFNTTNFPQQKEMTDSDHVIICGDFGGVWADTTEQKYWLDWLNSKPFTVLFVDGNHENFDMLSQFPVEKWNGGKVHRIRPNIIHLMRGQVFTIEGHTFFAMGGAASHDIQDGILDPSSPDFEKEYWFKRKTGQAFRVKGFSWWPEEMPSQEEYTEARRNLAAYNHKVDFIISHCGPSSIVCGAFGRGYAPDELTTFHEEINQTVDFQQWFFGHYHFNDVFYGKYNILYENIERII